MMWPFKKKPAPKALTGVRASLTAEHRPEGGGEFHDHTWEITAWFPEGGEAVWLRKQLVDLLDRWQGNKLPDTLSRGEKLARYIAAQLTDDYYGHLCVRVDVVRHQEGILALWPADG